MSFTNNNNAGRVDQLSHSDSCTNTEVVCEERGTTVIGKKALVYRCESCEEGKTELFVPGSDSIVEQVTVDGRQIAVGDEFQFESRILGSSASAGEQTVGVTLLQDGGAIGGWASTYVFFTYKSASTEGVRTGRLPATEFVRIVESDAENT